MTAITIVSLLVAGGLFVGLVTKPNPNPNGLRMGIVERVIDGDTIELSNGELVRYLDVDTPETVHPDKPVGCYGREATNRNKELIEGRTVYLEVPEKSQDIYGRTLAYVSTDDHFVNGELVHAGYAYARSYGEQGRLYQSLLQLERAARKAGRGLWANCQ